MDFGYPIFRHTHVWISLASGKSMGYLELTMCILQTFCRLQVVGVLVFFNLTTSILIENARLQHKESGKKVGSFLRLSMKVA
jgi:hypothetical protein